MPDNATYEEVNNDTNWTQPTTQNRYEQSKILEISLLLFILITSVLFNTWLIFIICRSYSLRRVTFNLLLLHISAACVGECVLNMTFSLYYMSSSEFILHYCAINSFTVQLISIQLTFGIVVMCVQRCFASWNPEYVKRHTIRKQTVVIATIWFISVVFSVPILSGVVRYDQIPQRFACGLLKSSRITYTYVITVCYALPITLSAICSTLLLNRRYRDIRNRNLRRLDLTYTELFFEESYIWNEWSNTKLFLVIFALYATTQLPYIIFYQLYQFGFRKKLTNDINIENLFTWFRYSFTLLYPFAIIFMRRDIRIKITTLIPKRRKNQVKCQRLEKYQRPDHFITPLLLAKSAGIQLNLLGINTDTKKKLWVKETSFPKSSNNISLKEESDNLKNNKNEKFEDATEEEIDCTILETPQTSNVREIAVQTSLESSNFDKINIITNKKLDKPVQIGRKSKKCVYVSKNMLAFRPITKRAKINQKVKCYRFMLNVQLVTPSEVRGEWLRSRKRKYKKFKNRKFKESS